MPSSRKRPAWATHDVSDCDGRWVECRRGVVARRVRRFRGTDPLITKRSRRRLAGELGHPDTSGRIPEARWMRAVVFERLVVTTACSRVATTTVGRLRLPRPDSVVVADARRDRFEDDRPPRQGAQCCDLGEQGNAHPRAGGGVPASRTLAHDVLPNCSARFRRRRAMSVARGQVTRRTTSASVADRRRATAEGLPPSRVWCGGVRPVVAASGAAGRPPVRGSGRAEERVPAADGDGRRPQGPPRRGPHPPGRAS